MKYDQLTVLVVQLIIAAIDRKAASCSCYGCLTFHGCDYKERNALATLLEQSIVSATP